MKIVYGIIIGVLLAFAVWLGIGRGGSKYIEKTDTVRTVEYRDSVVYKEKVVYKTNTIEVPTVVYKDTLIAGANIYSDTTKVEEGFHLFYEASVSGALNNIILGYTDERPEVFKIVEKTNTITNTINPTRVYVLGGIGEHINVGIAISEDDYLYQYSYGTNGHELKLGIKLWQKKQ